MQIDGNMSVTLSLTVDQANVILSSLGTQPFDKVVNIITLIQQQASNQIVAAQQAAQAPAASDAPEASND